MEVNDFNLLGKLSAGDMVALKSQYHKQCLVALYARTGQQPVVNQVEESTPQRVAFSEIVRKLEDCKMCTSDCKVLKLSDVMREYLTRLQELGAPTQDQSVHCTLQQDLSMAQAFLSFNTLVPLRKAMTWDKFILQESSPEKCINPFPASYTSVPAVVSKNGKPSVSPVSDSMMIGNQSTIADAISNEVEWLEDINKIYTAGKTKTDTRSVNAAIVREKTINDQSKV